MEFEWDENKREANKVKHGYDFDLAEVLLNSTTVTRAIPFEIHGEARLITMAEWNGDILVMIHTPRGDKQRIISIRKAHENERNDFRAATQN